MPPALQSRPSLDESNYLYYEIFTTLSEARGKFSLPTGQVHLNPIQFSEVILYCSELGIITEDDRFTYWRVIHAVDMAYLDDHTTRLKAK